MTIPSGLEPGASARAIIAGFCASLPDAASPVVAAPAGRTNRLLQRQLLRRAQIFAAARGQLASGNERVQVDDIARHCKLSPQTVYNIGGNSHDIMLGAIENYYSAQSECIAATLANGGSYGDMWAVMAASAEKNTGFMLWLTNAFFSQSAEVRHLVERKVQEGLVMALDRSALAPRNRAAVAEIAERTNALIAFSAALWLQGRVDLAGFQQRLREDFRIMLGSMH